MEEENVAMLKNEAENINAAFCKTFRLKGVIALHSLRFRIIDDAFTNKKEKQIKMKKKMHKHCRKLLLSNQRNRPDAKLRELQIVSYKKRPDGDFLQASHGSN